MKKPKPYLKPAAPSITIPIFLGGGIGTLTYTIEELAAEYVRARKIVLEARRDLEDARADLKKLETQANALRALLGSVRRLTDTVPAILGAHT